MIPMKKDKKTNDIYTMLICPGMFEATIQNCFPYLSQIFKSLINGITKLKKKCQKKISYHEKA